MPVLYWTSLRFDINIILWYNIFNMKNKSFTLIELLVVIVIIGILAGVIMISTSSSIDKANIAKSKVFADSLRNSLLLNLVSEWKLDGNALDSWGSNNGTWGGTTAPNTAANYRSETECVKGQCLHFDGYDDGVSFTSINYLTNNWTCEHWINWEGQTNSCVFYAGSGGTSPNFLLRNSNNYFKFRPAGGAETYYDFTNSGLYINKWTHVVWTADSSNNVILYVNGNRVNTINMPSPYNNSMVFYNIGRSYGGTSYTYLGKMDEVRVYDNMLSSSQIKQNYIAGLNSMLSQGNISKEDYNERINALAYGQ